METELGTGVQAREAPAASVHHSSTINCGFPLTCATLTSHTLNPQPYIISGTFCMTLHCCPATLSGFTIAAATRQRSTRLRSAAKPSQGCLSAWISLEAKDSTVPLASQGRFRALRGHCTSSSSPCPPTPPRCPRRGSRPSFSADLARRSLRLRQTQTRTPRPCCQSPIGPWSGIPSTSA